MSNKDERRTRSHRHRFEGVSDLFSEVNRVRTVGRHGPEAQAEGAERTYVSAWVPTIDILASGDDLVILVELPGIDPAEVDIRLTRGVLTVSGVRAGTEQDEESFLVRERYHGAFRRSIALPEQADPARITAEFANGLVQITVPGCVGEGEGTRISVQDRSVAAPPRVLGDA